MQTQWYLCEIEKYPRHEGEELKKSDNLSVAYPDIFVDGLQAILTGEAAIEDNKAGEGSWFVWLPIISRVGDTLQFAGWQVQVSQVCLEADWYSRTGVQEGVFVSARISIRDDVVRSLTSSQYSVDKYTDSIHTWETFARRGHDLQYFAWELKHEFYAMQESGEETTYKHWHTRIRPVIGDTIAVKDKRWRVVGVEIASANDSVDGQLSLEPVINKPKFL